MSKASEEMEGIKNIIEFIAQSYHASKLSEVKGLPSDEEIGNIDLSYLPHMTQSGRVLIDFGMKHMRSIAQQVIAKKDEELNKAKKEIERLKIWVNESIEHYEAIKRLGQMMPSEQCYYDCFKSFKDKFKP